MVMICGSWSSSEVLLCEKHAEASSLIFPPLSHPGRRKKRVPGDEVDSFSFQEAKAVFKDKTLVKALLSKSQFNKYTCTQQTLSRSQNTLHVTLSMNSIVLLNNVL